MDIVARTAKLTLGHFYAFRLLFSRGKKRVRALKADTDVHITVKGIQNYYKSEASVVLAALRRPVCSDVTQGRGGYLKAD